MEEIDFYSIIYLYLILTNDFDIICIEETVYQLYSLFLMRTRKQKKKKSHKEIRNITFHFKIPKHIQNIH